jgi:hypothetical protein
LWNSESGVTAPSLWNLELQASDCTKVEIAPTPTGRDRNWPYECDQIQVADAPESGSSTTAAAGRGQYRARFFTSNQKSEETMTEQRWRMIYWAQVGILICVFAVCAMNGWNKTAWFVVLPIGMIYCALLRRKKIPS